MNSVAEYLDRYGWQPKLERLDIYPRQRSEDNPETLLEIFQQNLKGEKANRPLGTITFFQAKASVLVLDLEAVELNPWPKKAEDWLKYLKEIDKAIDNNAPAEAAYIASSLLMLTLASAAPVANFGYAESQFKGDLSQRLRAIDKACLLYEYARGALGEATVKNLKAFLSSD